MKDKYGREMIFLDDNSESQICEIGIVQNDKITRDLILSGSTDGISSELTSDWYKKSKIYHSSNDEEKDRLILSW